MNRLQEEPIGARVLVRVTQTMSPNFYRAKVISLGPTAFSRHPGFCIPGDFVIIPRDTGDDMMTDVYRYVNDTDIKYVDRE